jgi:hypothetical protein
MRRRSKTEEDKALRENAYLLRRWNKFHAEQLEETLAGVHADVMNRLMAQLKELRSARELVAAVEAEDWSAVDANTRLIALHQINVAITKLRERADEETPISDPLPGQPLNAFLLAKQIITDSRIHGIAEPGSGASSGQTVTREAKEYVS